MSVAGMINELIQYAGRPQTSLAVLELEERRIHAINVVTDLLEAAKVAVQDMAIGTEEYAMVKAAIKRAGGADHE